jgi:hypothetical protein
MCKTKYDRNGYFSEGRARVRLNEKYGFMDLQGNEVIPLKYDYVGDFLNGKALIRIGNCIGYVDINGKESFSPEVRAKLRHLKIERLLKDL